MKVYELWFRNGDCAEEDSFTLWVATDRPIESPSALNCKVIAEYDESTPGVDLIIH